ncbi:MAG: hypothetical protein IKR48_13430 [Kiritimatiellae bacterium]|nr:hypothetical protein [Kiritimatiellia bacterium]
MKKVIKGTVIVGALALGAVCFVDPRIASVVVPSRVVLLVEDDAGRPVEGALVIAGVLRGVIQSHTDRNGRCSLKGMFLNKRYFRIEKYGYYTTSWEESLPRKDSLDSPAGSGVPAVRERRVTLRRRRNPVPMFAKHYNVVRLFFPATNTPVAFDMEVADWLPPHGKGRVRDFDMLLRWNGDSRADRIEMECIFTEPHSGFYILPKIGESEFKSPYRADEGAAYRTNLVVYSQWRNNPPGWAWYYDAKEKKRKCRPYPHLPPSESQDGGEYENSFLDDQCLVFRVRPKVDRNGKLLGAHYGKVYGPIGFALGYRQNGRRIGEGFLTATFYFNPTFNDTNLEYDPARNLNMDGRKRSRWSEMEHEELSP